MSKPLKVLLVGNLPEDRQHSMLGFGAVLAERLPEEGLQVRLLQPEARLSRSVPKTSRLSKWVGYFDKLVLFRRTLMKEAASHDLVHVLDQGNGLYASWTASRFRTLVTCHDLLAFLAALGHIPGWTKGATGRRQQDMNMAGLRAAHHVACVSEQTLDDCRIHLEIPADRLSLVYNGPYRPLFPADDRVWRELSG
ncbi:MAG: glycosyltransferase family 4 protein, partial [Fimbriimonadaceae bacterium]|nr:glycosyltransferase family 4 protein [Fimbriimonadaceae bacterium]